MNILELRKIVLAALLAFAAVTMLPACASSDESSDCNCAEGDWNCMDRCTQPGT